MSKRICVIINPASGQPEPILYTLNKVLQDAEINWDVCITHAGNDARKAASEAAEDGVDIVAVYGGDGTVMEAATGLIGSDVPLAILPGGTANAMASELDIPGTLEESCRLLIDPNHTVRAIDMGKAGDRYFVLRVEIGLGAERIRGASQELKNSIGLLAYWVSSVQAIPTVGVSAYQMEIDGDQIESDGVGCIIANSGNVGIPGVFLASGIDVSDGLLDVFVVRKVDIESVISLASSMAAVNTQNLSLPHWTARRITLTADPPQSIQGDGELWEKTPVTIEVVNKALQVVVPSDTSDSIFSG